MISLSQNPPIQQAKFPKSDKNSFFRQNKSRKAYSTPPLMVKPIRRFNSFQAASRFIDLRLQQKPSFCFNIQQTAFDTWIVSRVI